MFGNRLHAVGAAIAGLAANVAVVSCAHVNTASSGRCCSALSNKLPGQVVYPNTTSYEDRLEAIWSVTAALEPWCFVLPESTNDTSVVIQTLYPEGVTLDFGYMNTTTYDEDEKVASVPPGTTWQDVYETLSPYGVIVAGGRAGGVGTAGFITGGGNSFFSTSHGWACDNVKNFEVVLANGTVVDANADENDDLWQALKGGSGNVGLVTRFDMYPIAFPDPDNQNIWGGVAQYELSANDDLIAAYVDFTENNYKDKNSSTMLYWVYTQSAGSLIAQVAMDNTLNEAYPAAYDTYLNTSGLIDTSLRSALLTNITEEFSEGQPSGLQNIWITSTFDNDARVIKYAEEKHVEYIVDDLAPQLANDSGLVTLCSMFPLTQAMIEHGAARGGNAMGLEAASAGKNGVLFLASLAVDSAADAALARPLMERWVADVDAYAESLGAKWDWRFLNYAIGYQDPVATYATEKIRKAAEKFDPTGVFQKLRRTGHRIPPKE